MVPKTENTPGWGRANPGQNLFFRTCERGDQFARDRTPSQRIEKGDRPEDRPTSKSANSNRPTQTHPIERHNRTAARPNRRAQTTVNLGRNFRTTQLQAFKSLPGGFEPDAVRIAQRCSQHFEVISGTSSAEPGTFRRVVSEREFDSPVGATRVQQTSTNSLP